MRVYLLKACGYIHTQIRVHVLVHYRQYVSCPLIPNCVTLLLHQLFINFIQIPKEMLP